VPFDVPDILPNVSAVYRKKAQRLAAALNDPREQAEAAEASRALIERITLRSGPNRREVDAAKTDIPVAEASGMSVSVVAGAGFEPTTFRSQMVNASGAK
jgi:hypothetical protein